MILSEDKISSIEMIFYEYAQLQYVTRDGRCSCKIKSLVVRYKDNEFKLLFLNKIRKFYSSGKLTLLGMIQLQAFSLFYQSEYLLSYYSMKNNNSDISDKRFSV